MSVRPFVILADDATGAMDAGMQLLSSAGTIRVMLDIGADGGPPDVLVRNLNTRNTPPEAAADIARTVARADYKKIDSTMRGNIGAELRALHQTGRWDAFVVCPALPESGRTTVNGTHYVGGVPLAQTEFAHDPFAPIASSDIRDIVGQGVPLIVPDAATRGDLDRIAAEYQGKARILLCGSAGLLGSMKLSLGDPGERRPLPPARGAPQLILNGSAARATKRQIDHLLMHDPCAARVTPNLALLGTGRWHEECARVLDALADALEDEGRVVLDVAADSRRQLAALDQDTLQTHSGAVQDLLMDAAAMAVQQFLLSALYIIGGDALMSVSTALGASAIDIAAQALPLIPAGLFVDGLATDVPIITKAGGFGAEDALTVLARKMGER